MRKFLSVLLAMAMVLSLSVTSFAADTDSEAKAEMAGKTVILHTNDVHGAIAGYAYITALKADYEAKGAEVILVDAGDYSQGTSYVSVTKGLDAIEMMNAAGYDVVTLGNHEFDYGYAQLKENMTKADFKILCANVYGEDGTPIFDANYTYTTKSGVKIGFFGMETPEPQTKANPTKIKGLTFATGDAFTKAAADQVAALKSAGVPAAYINSSLTGEQIHTVYARTRKGAYKLIYVAPERLETNSFLSLMQEMDVSFLAVDEAHCISQWGQDFRPSYLGIVDFINALPRRPIVAAYTATATKQVQSDLSLIHI